MFDKLIQLAGEGNVRINEPMSSHTTFRCGGPADYFVTITNEKTLIQILSFLHQNHEEYLLIGNGSNLLIRDEGYRGAVLKLGGDFRRISTFPESHKIHCGSGAILANVAMAAAKEGLTGMEFAYGIPGSVGGAVVMNAGAYGGEMKQILKSVRILKDDNSVQEYSAHELCLGYRDSILKHQKGIVLSAEIELEKGEPSEIQALMEELTRQRREKQPLEYPSAGSTFKRPEGYFAGKLIQDAGLKGYRVGGAQVSEKHAGFVVNTDHATAQDIITLIEDVTRIVKENSGITLEPEVIIV